MSALSHNISKRESQASVTSSQAGITPLFLIELDDTTVINKILCEMNSPLDSSTFIVSRQGLRLVVNGDRTSQVSVFFSSGTFSNFVFASDDVIRYTFLLKDFIEALNLLRDEATEDNMMPSKTSLQMFYIKRGDPLKLRFENNTFVSVNCDLKEFSSPLLTQSLMSFSELEETAEVVFNSKELYKYVTGLDMASSVFLKIILEQGEIPVRLLIESPLMGEVELEIRKGDSKVIIGELTVPNNQIFNFNYRCKFIAPAFEALRKSSVAKLKCGSNGLLLMEHYHGQEPQYQSVEYFVLSEVEF